MNLIGRKKEMRELQRYYDSPRPELIIVYGRRRVGKTYLIKEFFENKFAFYFTGTVAFWNSWASAVPEILFIGCGSATSWITKKLFQNRGGLHNRVTGRIYLSPFSLGECEEFFKSRKIEMTRYQMAESYMIFGGIPYYLNLFDSGLSFITKAIALV